MSKKKKKANSATKERDALVFSIVDQFDLPEVKARAIVARYGPSQQKCNAAASTLLKLQRLLDQE